MEPIATVNIDALPAHSTTLPHADTTAAAAAAGDSGSACAPSPALLADAAKPPRTLTPWYRTRRGATMIAVISGAVLLLATAAVVTVKYAFPCNGLLGNGTHDNKCGLLNNVAYKRGDALSYASTIAICNHNTTVLDPSADSASASAAGDNNNCARVNSTFTVSFLSDHEAYVVLQAEEPPAAATASSSGSGSGSSGSSSGDVGVLPPVTFLVTFDASSKSLVSVLSSSNDSSAFFMGHALFDNPNSKALLSSLGLDAGEGGVVDVVRSVPLPVFGGADTFTVTSSGVVSANV
jgi:hypothetical protein